MRKHAAGGLTLYARDGTRKYINADERRQFLEAAEKAPPLVHTLCLTLTYTGCRISEALNLAAHDIQACSQTIAFRTLKTHSSAIVVREVPVPKIVIDALDEAYALSSHSQPNGVAEMWPWHRTRAWQLIKRVMDDAGISGTHATPKGLRHGFGVWAAQSGVPLNIIQRWLGHTDIATTAIYVDAVGPEQIALATRMWEGGQYKMPTLVQTESGRCHRCNQRAAL